MTGAATARAEAAPVAAETTWATWRDALRTRPVEALWWLPLVAAAVLLGLGLALLAQHTWYPVGDLGQANMRMLSFWSHPPLVGPAGRIIGEGGVQGNHPGPAIFWAAWPLWRLLGGSSWALNASVAATNLTGVAVALACARRLGGRRVAAGIGVVSLTTLAGFGPEVMLQPWNPSMALTWYLVLVVATWGVVLGHRGMLPIVAGAASYVVQCHAGYAPPALLLCAVAGIAAVRVAWRDRADGGTARLLPWLAGAAATAGVLWTPPIVDQLTNEPGNISILLHSFTHPDEDYVGLGRALQVLLLQLDPTGGPIRGAEWMDGLPLLGTALVLTWIGTGLWARRRLGPRWRALDLVLLVSLLGSWFAISRIFGAPFVYLYRWTWILAALVVLATAAHLVAGGRDRTGDGGRRLVAVGLAAGLVVGVVAGGLRYGRTEVSGLVFSDTMATLIGPTEAALDPDEDYLVRWQDPAGLGGVGFGMVLELERRGYDVGVDEQYSAAAEPHRVRDEADVDAVIWVMSGETAIDRATEMPGAEVVATADPRTPAERARYDALAERAASRLEEVGLAAQGESVRTGGNLLGILLANPDLPDDIVTDITDMIVLFLPTEVIVTPPAT